MENGIFGVAKIARQKITARAALAVGILASLWGEDSASLQVQQFGLCDCGDLSYRLEDGRRNGSVQAHQRHGLGAYGGLPPAKRERGDIDAKLAQCRADLSDYAGFIAIAQIQNCALELRLHRYSVYLQYAR